MRFWTFLLIVCLAIPLHSAEQRGEEKTQMSVSQLTQVGILIASLGNGTSRLGRLLEEGNMNDVNAAIEELHVEIDRFGEGFKELTGPEHSSSVDAMVAQLHRRLDDIAARVNEDNLAQAQESYRKLSENWGRLSDYASDSVSSTLENKEEVKGWLNWVTDSVYGYFYPEEEAAPAPAD